MCNTKNVGPYDFRDAENVESSHKTFNLLYKAGWHGIC